MHHFTATVTAYCSRICVYVCDVLVCIAHVIWKLYFQSSLFFVWFCFLLHFLPTISMLKVISNYELCKLTEQHLSARNWCNCFPLYFCKKIKHLRSSLSWLWINQSFTKRFCALIYIFSARQSWFTPISVENNERTRTIIHAGAVFVSKLEIDTQI